MGKIDIDKFVCSLFEIVGNTSYKIRMSNIIDALRHQGLEYKDGAIVAIEKPSTIKFEPELSEFEDRLGEIVIPTWDIAKECEECKGDVEDVKKWAKELLDIAHRQFSKEEANNLEDMYKKLK